MFTNFCQMKGGVISVCGSDPKPDSESVAGRTGAIDTKCTRTIFSKIKKAK